MEAIDPEADEGQPRSQSPYRVPAALGDEAVPRSACETDPAMIFATVTLLIASLVRLAPPLAGHEAFGVEPTLALGAVLGCSWLALREGVVQVRERLAVRRAAAIVRSRTIESSCELNDR